MVLLFFVLDLRTLSPPLLSQVKQCLLELANLYALSAPTLNLKRHNSDSSLDDRIGLCYLRSSAVSSSDEFKTAYCPRGRSFNLRDFHYAVHHLPSDSYLPLLPEDSGSFLLRDVEFSSILSNEVFYCAGSEEIEKKVILVSSCLVANMDSKNKTTLLDAADKCISVEFVFLEQKSSQLSDISEKMNEFRGQICELENCSFNAYLPDVQVLNGLAKRWLRELKENTVLLQAHFLFQRSISGSVNRICCRLCDSTNQILDRFNPREAHRCLGVRRDDRDGHGFEDCLLSHVKKHDMELDSTDNNSTSAGENGLLTKASQQCWKDLCHVPSTIIFNIIERTSLASLSEGIMIGRPYFVIPSVVQESDTAPEDSDTCQLNNRLFQGLCRALYSMDQGLVCWSFCNLEIMSETEFTYYYILLPSDSGLMLLRRLVGAEEILPFPDVNMNDSSTTEEIDCCIQQCLLDVELRDYNPVQHNGGFHQNLNQLVEESLQPGQVAPVISTTPSTSTCLDDVAVLLQPSLVRNIATLPREDLVALSGRETAAVAVQTCASDQADEDDKGIASLAHEWEQKIVGGIPRMGSALADPNLEKARASLPTSHRTLDTRTSNILQRLGNPELIKTKAKTHKILSGFATHGNGTTNNHFSVDVDAVDQGSNTTSNLMKPTFQRLKRKQRLE
ncbi:uncharacterized protein LOC104908337 isoform X1 [Beta vulgaris subsp. vulgaris]|uniref:uncharacterized protein LOC104908337 isoform X1 n=1 Tax=Beta vulgaris subsp. vulgaris TaxID=3555 RepID=UPI002037410D|nr:uncharacterized protein LOC104908337 isoform X1 [Beta vulgaris subsp. vulgaris]XP_057251140.1 uncharacterized protein LOC104908337 isoform X1 [Beta vulgaris subsp. vulgaris]